MNYALISMESRILLWRSVLSRKVSSYSSLFKAVLPGRSWYSFFTNKLCKFTSRSVGCIIPTNAVYLSDYLLHNIYRNILTNQSALKIRWRHLCVCTVITHGCSTNKSARNIKYFINTTNRWKKLASNFRINKIDKWNFINL